jgi:hypothetical protein
LVFMHIPKTSGISTAQAIVDAIKPQRTFFGFDRSFFGAFDAFGTIAAENRALIHFSPDTLPPNEPVIRAHMSLSTLRAAYPRGRFMTVLREPRCRLLSHYLFWRGFTPAQLEPWGAWAEHSRIAEQPLAAFLTDPRIACQTDNVATRLLLWPNAAIPPGAFIDPEHDASLIGQARAALKSLDFADLIENPAFIANLAAFLGKPPPVLARYNETAALPPHLRMQAAQALSPAALAALRARSRLDRVLWHTLAMSRGIAEPPYLAEDSLLQGTARFADLLAGRDPP